jgi:hypothetical protein
MRLRWWILLLVLLTWDYAHCSIHYTHGTLIRHKHKALVVETRMFLPSHEAQLRQNEAIDEMGLHRYKNDKEMHLAVKSGELVAVPTGPWLSASPRLPKNRQYVRPWLRDFLLGMGYSYYLQFGSTIQVNSAVRTIQVQRSLLRWNPNAAPVHGEAASSHLAGATVDLQRRGLTLRQLFWIQNYLKLMGDRVIVIEELREPCFHVMILPEKEECDGWDRMCLNREARKP